MVDEGLAIVKGVRDRHDGVGATRGTSSSAATTTPARCRAGRCCWRCPASTTTRRPHLKLDPQVNKHDFRCIFTTGAAWGAFIQRRDFRLYGGVEVGVGVLTLSSFALPIEGAAPTATVNGVEVTISAADGVIRFAERSMWPPGNR